MANVIINNVSYQAVPYVSIPKVGGGSAAFYDTSDANVDAASILAGAVGYGASGKVNGTLTTVQVSQDSTTKVLSIS